MLAIFNKLNYVTRIMSKEIYRYPMNSLSMHYHTLSFNVKQCSPYSEKSCCLSKSISGTPLKIMNACPVHLSNIKRFSDESNKEVKITYIDRDGENHVIKGQIGDNVMYLAQKHDLDIEGACEASLACCTCHVYVENFFDKLNHIEEEEEDMLDLAPFLQENSRLSCQIILSEELDGLIVRLPTATRNFYVDGHKPKPH